LSRHKELLDDIWRLRRTGHTAGQIADRLNSDGWSTATQRNSFNDRLVRMILHRYGTVPKGARRPPNDDPNDWWLADLADEIEVPLVTLYGWMKRGRVKARRVEHHPRSVAAQAYTPGGMLRRGLLFPIRGRAPRGQNAALPGGRFHSGRRSTQRAARASRARG
jgi:hypothetical protein